MGKVYLIGAGPGDPELIDGEGRCDCCKRATIVLHDSLVSREVLALIPPAAEVIDVGKRCGQKLLTQEEINALLVSYADGSGSVIRLKGGDPLIFGRAGEEIEALRQAGIEFEVVPGITAALGAAAAANISLTDRRAASQVVIATFSRGSENSTLNWAAVTSKTTLVLYMPGADYAEVSRRMSDAGLPDDLPCVIVSNATTPQQQMRHTTVSGLAQQEKLPAPALLIVGRVAAQDARPSEGRALAGRHLATSDFAAAAFTMESQLARRRLTMSANANRQDTKKARSAVARQLGGFGRLRRGPADPKRCPQAHPLVIEALSFRPNGGSTESWHLQWHYPKPSSPRASSSSASSPVFSCSRQSAMQVNCWRRMLEPTRKLITGPFRISSMFCGPF